MYSLLAFDLDDTLAPSKSPLPERMAVALRDLLDLHDVCVISGGNFDQFRTQLLSGLGASDAQLSPTSHAYLWHTVHALRRRRVGAGLCARPERR